MKHYSKEQVLQALDESGGILKGASSILGCNYRTLAKYINIHNISSIKPYQQVAVLKDVLGNSKNLTHAAATLGISKPTLLRTLKSNNLSVTLTVKENV